MLLERASTYHAYFSTVEENTKKHVIVNLTQNLKISRRTGENERDFATDWTMPGHTCIVWRHVNPVKFQAPLFIIFLDQKTVRTAESGVGWLKSASAVFPNSFHAKSPRLFSLI